MFRTTKEKLLERYRSRIRESAIDRARKRLAAESIDPNELPPDDLEAVVEEEERKLKQRLKDYSLAALIAILTAGHI